MPSNRVSDRIEFYRDYAPRHQIRIVISDHTIAVRTFQTLIDAAVDGIIVIDESGAIEVFNKAAETMFGYSQAEILGKNVATLMPEPDQSAHNSYIKNFLHKREAKIIGRGRDVIAVRRNGEEFPINLSIGETREDGQSKFVGLIRDITESKVLTEQLNLVNDELKLIFDEAPTGIIVAHTSGRIINSNPWLTEFLGFEPGALINTNLGDLASDTDRDRIAEEISALRESRKDTSHFDLELKTKRKGTHQVTMKLSLAGVRSGNQRLIALIIDRTEEIAKILISERAREQLAHSDRLNSLGEMASAIAHEINQPLTAINSYALASKRMLDSTKINDLNLPDEIADVLQKISNQAQRGAEIVRRIRGFATKSEIHRTPANVNDCILSAIELTRFNADSIGIQLTTGLSPSLPLAIIDEVQIQQVCINLIRNAIDAMADAPGRLMVHSCHRGEQIEVEFIDDGPGVATEIVDRLFQPFQSGKKNGLGLGLSISHKIIADHRGELTYRENIPNGSIFKFSLPVMSAK
ncbi:MAG: PAS domain-containing sensor histidine kinase [Gammaproteobacteria bacterium]